MKVLHLPTSVAGQAMALSEAERKIGLESDCLVAFKDKYYPEVPAVFGTTPDNIIQAIRYLPKIISGVFEIADSDYDILHFNFSRSLLDYPGVLDMLDLDLYPQKMVVTFNGCDARLRDLGLAHSPCDDSYCQSRVCWINRNDKKQSRIDKWRRYASEMFVSTPDLLRSVPDASFIPNTVYGFHDIAPVKHENDGDIFTIIHAPTNRFIKGTDTIERVVASLKKEHHIRLVTIEGKTREDALELYRTADLAIDQIRLGWYGVFAIECMKMGIPVVAYCREAEMLAIPPEKHRDLGCSIINANPDTLHEVLHNIIDNTELLEIARYYGKRFADRWHSPEYVASLTRDAYRRVLR